MSKAEQPTAVKVARQLSAMDVAQRKQTIIALGRSKDPSVIRVLDAVSKGDPEPELRDLARRAKLYIETHIKEQTPAASFTASPADVSSVSSKYYIPGVTEVPDLPPGSIIKEKPADTPPPEPKPERPRAYYVPGETPVPETPTGKKVEVESVPAVVVPEANARRAKLLLEEGLGLHLYGDDVKAMTSLSKALSMNPALADDLYFMSVVAMVTKREGAAGLAMIRDKQQRKLLVVEKKQQQAAERVERHVETASREKWLAVAVDLLIYAAIVIVGPLVLALVLSETAQNYMHLLAQRAAEGAAAAPAEISQPISVGAAVTLGLIIGITNVVGVLVQNVAVHVFSTRVRGGKGTLRYLLAAVLGTYNRYLPILFALGVGAIWLTFFLETPFILPLGGILLVGYYLYISVQVSKRISQAYEFDSGSGCLSTIVGDIVLTAINIVLVVVIYPLVATSLVIILPGG